MKKNLSEIIILVIQLFMFYIFPVFMYLVEPIATVMLILITTIILSFVLAIISNNKLKYLYPIVIAILFLPTVFIYYNESALVHSIWYLVVSVIGLFVGTIIKQIANKIPKNGNLNIIVTILIIIAIGISIYFMSYKEYTIGKESDIEIIKNAVSLGVKEDTLSRSGVTLILKNDSNGDVIYSAPYEIEVRKDDEWHKINIEIDFIEIAYILESQHSTEIVLDWGEAYGKLPFGDYRIIKEVTISNKDETSDSFFISAEFNI